VLGRGPGAVAGRGGEAAFRGGHATHAWIVGRPSVAREEFCRIGSGTEGGGAWPTVIPCTGRIGRNSRPTSGDERTTCRDSRSFRRSPPAEWYGEVGARGVGFCVTSTLGVRLGRAVRGSFGSVPCCRSVVAEAACSFLDNARRASTNGRLAGRRVDGIRLDRHGGHEGPTSCVRTSPPSMTTGGRALSRKSRGIRPSTPDRCCACVRWRSLDARCRRWRSREGSFVSRPAPTIPVQGRSR
jgi:hypothetical protein